MIWNKDLNSSFLLYCRVIFFFLSLFLPQKRDLLQGFDRRKWLILQPLLQAAAWDVKDQDAR